MKAFILAAGLGTRLRPLTDRLPKVMAPIDHELPLLEHVICHLKSHGISDFVVNLHYRADCITEYFGDGGRLGVRIEYSDETEHLLDTAGAVRKAAPLLGDEFLLVYGDQVHFFDFTMLLQAHRRGGGIATVALKRSDDPRDGDLAETGSDGRVVRWHPRPHGYTTFSDGLYLNTGIYVLTRQIVDRIPAGQVSLDRQILPRLVAEGLPVFGVIAGDDILDIGTPEKYAHARKWFAAHPARKRRALFLDRDGVIFRAFPRGEYITDWRQVALADGIKRVVSAAQAAGYVTIVATNQPQISRHLIDEAGVEAIHRRMTDALDGSVDGVYYCPHTDADGCECRKPKPGLLLRARRDWNICMERSIMVGDSDRDILAGAAGGCRTIFVRNEHNADEADRCSPSAFVNSVAEIIQLL